MYTGAELKTFERGPMALLRRACGTFLFFTLIFLSGVAVPLHAQVARPATFLAEHYDVSASLDAIGQSISATAKINFKAIEASSSVRVELHPNLIVKEVKGADGKALTFERDNQNSLVVVVQLATPVATDGHVTLTYTYAGLLFNEENSPVPGLRAAAINKDGAYLLLPARWFPVTNFPSNRYTATFRLNVPDSFAVAGTGKALAPTPTKGRNSVEGNRLIYTFQCNAPAPHGTFIAGNLQLNPKQAEGVSVNVYAPREASGDAQKFADSVARSTTAFSDMFGPLPRPEFTVAQLPDGTLRDFAAPGLLLLSKRIWDPRASDRTIARLVASQWWGNAVLPATRGDVWISDGLARYSEALYAEQNAQASAKAGQPPPDLHSFFAQWLNSTGVPDFTIEYVVYRTHQGFRVVGKIKQPLDTFHMPVDLRIDTEGNPETKTVDAVGTDSEFTVETFGRPKPGGIKVDPSNVILKGSSTLRTRAAIARGEELAEQGRYYDAIGQYQRALSIQPNRPLANFRMGEAFFYQKNYQAAANAFRDAGQTVPEPSEKWTEVWSHIYLGKIFDLLGQRARAVNEYSKAKQTNDDTGGAQQVAEQCLKKAYTEGDIYASSPANGAGPLAENRQSPPANYRPVRNIGSHTPRN